MSALSFSGLHKRFYRVILMDPPWFWSGGKDSRPQHYPRMRDHEIAALPIADLAHPDGCWVFCWATSAMTDRLFTKIAPHWSRPGRPCDFSGLGFTWVKLQPRFSRAPADVFFRKSDLATITGFTTRKNSEPCWLFKFGRPKRLEANIHEIILSPQREHSRKPDETFERIEQFAAGPYCEIFARERRPGWDACGNETNKFRRQA